MLICDPDMKVTSLLGVVWVKGHIMSKAIYHQAFCCYAILQSNKIIRVFDPAELENKWRKEKIKNLGTWESNLEER